MKNLRHFKITMLEAFLFIATIFGVSSICYGQKPNDTKSDAKEKNETKYGSTNKEKDAKFLVDVAEINLEEIQLGQLAQQKSTMADVKELGKMMETSHQKCMKDLETLAKKKSITIPTSLTDNGKDAYKKLNELSGTSFDKEYCDMMVKGHKDAIAEFEKVSKDSGDADIKQFALATLPELKKHLEHATACQTKCEKMK
jgi:putative membrane protein